MFLGSSGLCAWTRSYPSAHRIPRGRSRRRFNLRDSSVLYGGALWGRHLADDWRQS
ncbi:MAG: hypothetical protein K0S37_4442, partial [Microbacterium sp.]|nr:hypothetical protein [Microbacterium sp.]